ncbi:phosphoglycerate mutase-like protein [Decorospora gaudefroyi]|uniref:Phosphoglycerate mutase-like protein n=1 Tax=Decorospora gaudefroyi TaxID=184978 RepID=A0A6A5KAR9_9PLEO|nr:phosphoglycerate mutase-like protein [Decorospora gaudefroyi]
MFTRTAIAGMASAWLAGVQAASDSNAYHTHGVFAFIRTGERTPFLRKDTQTLTGVGAKQMHDLGQDFRTRYITGDTSNPLSVAPIPGISTDFLNNDLLWIQTLDEPHLMSAAQAFMQGLYPISNGTTDTGVLADGITEDYPLKGYQYASIRAASKHDPASRIVSGVQNCPVAQRDKLRYLTTKEFQETKAATSDLYESLNVDWFEGHLSKDVVQYDSAIEIYDYISYQYTHNSRIHDTLANDTAFTGVYDQLRYLADEEAWHMYGNTSTSDTDADNQAIGGKTLAGAIMNTFRFLVVDKNNTGDQTDMSYPLTLYFGEQDTMMSLLSLMLMTDSEQNGNFKAIPSYGSAMVFELFSRGETADFPSDPNDVFVKFSFHNATGTVPDAPKFQSYPMFNEAQARAHMKWTDFLTQFSKISMKGITEWCDSCESPALFCTTGDGGADRSTPALPNAQASNRNKVSTIVAGVIGAVVAVAVAGLLFALAMLLGGVRFHRVERNRKMSSGLGGFKGSAKLASDPDLGLVKNGAPPAGVVIDSDAKKGHERYGSWELRQKELRPGMGEQRMSDDDVGVNGPVEPYERV